MKHLFNRVVIVLRRHTCLQFTDYVFLALNVVTAKKRNCRYHGTRYYRMFLPSHGITVKFSQSPL